MFLNPVTNKKHRKWHTLHKSIGAAVAPAVLGKWDEIVRFGPLSSHLILGLFSPALEAEYVDLDRKGRGSCLNHDLYAYDPEQGVAVVQARQYYKRAAKHYGATRKTYFLCGKNEITGEFFRHPVGSHAVRAACRAPGTSTRANVVWAAQRWMWGVTEKQLSSAVRQGDVLLVPERVPKNATPRGVSLTVANSHRILADEIRDSGRRIYVLNPTMVHSKNQHTPVECVDGWYSVRVARESRAWDFAERVGD